MERLLNEERVGAGERPGDIPVLALTAEGLQQRSEWPRVLHSLVHAHKPEDREALLDYVGRSLDRFFIMLFKLLKLLPLWLPMGGSPSFFRSPLTSLSLSLKSLSPFPLSFPLKAGSRAEIVV